MERVRSGIQKIAADLLARLPLEEAVVAAWPLACGASLAKRTKALELIAGRLRVQVPDAGWCGQLEDFSANYISTMNAIVRSRVVKKIEYVPLISSNSSAELKKR